jgi:4-hydroxybutyrate CoA-transferase
MKIVDATTAVQLVSSGDRVYIHEAAMAPSDLIQALVERADELENVEIMHLHTEVPAPYTDSKYDGHLRLNALFVGANVRDAVNSGAADYTPVFLSEIPSLIADGTLAIDVAFVQLSPPDRHGYCRLGTSVACARAAVDSARVVVAELNPSVPRTMGNSAVHISRIDAAIEVDRPLPVHQPPEISDIEQSIGEHVAAIIPTGATVQVGIGSIPSAILRALSKHEDLGVHTEMFTDELIDLVEAGVITNRLKTRFQGRIVTSFASGTQRLFDFVNDNPFVEFHPSNIVNDPAEIRLQHSMVALNSAIEIDLTGQVCADSIGERIFSGIGGQMDFIQGAIRARDGKAIIALPSTARNDTTSRIVPRLRPGAGVVTTRGHVQCIVTEYGAVNLRGRSLRERADLLISVAHPDFRPELRQAAVERKLFSI